MSDLVYELLLVLLLATAIGWFLGRYLCKSGEYVERAQKQQLGKQLDATLANLVHRDKALEEARQQLNGQGQLLAELGQQKGSLEAQVDSLQQERSKLLQRQRDFEACQARVVTLEGDLGLQQQQVAELKLLKREQEVQIDGLEAALNQGREQLAQSRKQHQDTQDNLGKAQAELARQEALLAELRKDRQKLQQVSLQYDEARSRIGLLEDEKKTLHGRFTELNNEHQQMRQQCQSLRNDTLQFNDRFSGVMREKEVLSQEVERLNIEKHDYLGRLRAISSVVDMIGNERP